MSGWDHLADADHDPIVGGAEGAQHPLKVGAPCRQDRLVAGDWGVVQDKENIGELVPSPQEPLHVLLNGGARLAPDVVLETPHSPRLVPADDLHHQRLV